MAMKQPWELAAVIILITVASSWKPCRSEATIDASVQIDGDGGNHARKMHLDPRPWSKKRPQARQEEVEAVGMDMQQADRSALAAAGVPGGVATCTHHTYPAAPGFTWMSTEATRQQAQVTLGNRARLAAAMDRFINKVYIPECSDSTMRAVDFA